MTFDAGATPPGFQARRRGSLISPRKPRPQTSSYLRDGVPSEPFPTGRSGAIPRRDSSLSHGVSRSTLDLDLLTTDTQPLEAAFWTELEEAGIVVDARRGDSQDPLAGVVRLAAEGERPVDLIVGRFSWQADIVRRAVPMNILGTRVAAAEPADLILLKLYAGGSQDCWDVQQLLASGPAPDLIGLVEARLPELPVECADLWRELSPSQ